MVTEPTSGQAHRRPPVFFSLHGTEIDVAYLTHALIDREVADDPEPALSVHTPEFSKYLRGDALLTVDGPFGRVVSGVVRQHPLGGTTVFSLLVPTVAVESGRATTVHTMGITTVHRGAVMALDTRTQTRSTVLLSGAAAEHPPRSDQC